MYTPYIYIYIYYIKIYIYIKILHAGKEQLGETLKTQKSYQKLKFRGFQMFALCFVASLLQLNFVYVGYGPLPGCQSQMKV